jgi:hypothetical protein
MYCGYKFYFLAKRKHGVLVERPIEFHVGVEFCVDYL